MPAQPTSTGGKLVSTGTVGVYRRDARFLVPFHEDGKKIIRTFSTLEAASAFRRDFVVPRFKRGKHRPSISDVSPPARDAGWVYFFQCQGGDQSVKIGWSTNPRKRLSALQSSQPHGLGIVALLPGGRGMEIRLHAVFKEYQLTGEWFSREVVDLLAQRIVA